MLYGKLVVASNVGGIPELVDIIKSPGVKLVDLAHSEELTEALSSFLTLDLKEVNEIGIKNREYVRQKFDNKKSVKSFIKILDRIA